MNTATSSQFRIRKTSDFDTFLISGLVWFIELTLEEGDTIETVADRVFHDRNRAGGLADYLVAETSSWTEDEIEDAVEGLSKRDVMDGAEEVLG